MGGKEGDVILTNVLKAFAGSEHCICLTEEGMVYAWGWNEHGNCGLGHVDNVHQPTKVDLDNRKIYRCFAGSGHSFAIVTIS